MSFFKVLSGLLILFFLIVGAITLKETAFPEYLKQNSSNLLETIKYKLGIISHNINEDINPSRKVPVTVIDRQAKLEAFIPQVFENYTEQDWREFWNLIYGYQREGEGIIKQKVYRSKEEIEDYLKYYYPDPFNFMQAQHWDYFWSLALRRQDAE